MKKEYLGVIFTDHAINRLHNRNVSQQKAYQTLKRPQKRRPGKTSGAHKFFRDFGDYRLELIARKNDKSQWVVLTCWIKDKFPRKQTKKKSLLNRLLRIFTR